MLGRLGRNDQPVGDLGVRQAGSDEAQNLALADGQLAALAADCPAAAGAQVAQQRGGLIGVPARAEALEGVARGTCGRERERRAASGLDARKGEPGTPLLQRKP